MSAIVALTAQNTRRAAAVVVTGGHGDDPIDHFYDGNRHVEIPVDRHDVPATHGAGCTHSAALAAELAKGRPLEGAVRTAAQVASNAVRRGLVEVGAGGGPVDALGLSAWPCRPGPPGPRCAGASLSPTRSRPTSPWTPP